MFKLDFIEGIQSDYIVSAYAKLTLVELNRVLQ
jgi:hypothetical protein